MRILVSVPTKHAGENIKVLEQHLNNKLSAKTTNTWLDLLKQAGVPAGPINTIVQIPDDPKGLAGENGGHQSHPDAGPSQNGGVSPLNSQGLQVGQNNQPPVTVNTPGLFCGTLATLMKK
ncbi:MAG: hypothetical protein CM1200mP18_21230 [Gammaproteobacteria bacterium]|nr:MAG: hypothetical protein CM1200mP18_21230 [Gammaproteobacteria bacterium]